MPQKRGNKRPATPCKHWSKAKTYEELKAIANKLPLDRPPGENWAIMERMRQLRYGYKPGELKMVPVMEVVGRRTDGTETVVERSLRKKDGTFIKWKYPTKPLEEVIRKYYP